MNTSNDNKEEEEFTAAMLLTSASVLPMILRVAFELDLFEIMAKASPSHEYLSASEIVSRLPNNNPEAPAMLERVLRFLANSSVLLTRTTTADIGNGSSSKTRLYGLADVCKYFVPDHNGVSLAACLLLLQDKVVTECWCVQLVAGDMFESVPKEEVIFMKWILHDWSNDKCVKLLKNCWDALPECGKVIVMEAILSEEAESKSDMTSKRALYSDMVMLALNPGGKERTEKEYDALAKMAGFASTKLICQAASN